MGEETTTNSAAVTAGPPPTSADPQDPLPESNWFWRRLLTFVGCGLCALGLGIVLWIYFTVATEALGSADTANGAQITLHTIEALSSLSFWLVVLVLVNLTLYLIAPSAEQAAKMLATVQAWRAGVSTFTSARVATPTSSAETRTIAGPAAATPAAPAATQEAPPAPPAPAPPAPDERPAGAAEASQAASAPAEATPAPAASSQALPAPISFVSVDLLRVACPATPREQLALYVEPIRKACLRFEINTIRRLAAFVAQMSHESSGFTATGENLNYTAKRLTQVWPGRFPTLEAAKPYARNPEKLANKVYGGRMGNGPEASGDGWRFRGGGPLQLTGRQNWTGFAKAMGMKLEEALAYGRTPEGGIMAAAWFWEANDINRLADTPGVADETKKINGGTTGLADREKKFNALVARMLKLEKGAA